MSRHILRPTHAASFRCAHPLLPVAQQSLHTRGLRTSQALHIEELFGLLATFFEPPSVPETTILESPGDVHPERAAFYLGGLARATQDSRKRSPTITTLSPERLMPADIIHLPRDAQTVTVSFKPLLELSSTIGASTTTPIVPATPAAATVPSPTPGATTPPGFVPRATHAPTAHAARHPRVPHEVTLRAASGASDLEGVQFPAGFACLYYHTPAAPCTPLAGALRLRILPVPAIALETWPDQGVRDAFARGHDFCVRPGIPWHVPVLTLTGGSSGPGYDAVRAMLLHERLVAPRVMRDAEREGERWSLKRYASRVVHSFGQPFVVDLGAGSARFYFVGRRMVYRHTVRNLCSWNLPGPGADEEHQPFTGRLVCAFERSKVPKDVGKPFVMIRVLEVLSPVHRNPRYSGPQDIPLPRAGKLLARGIRRHAPHRPSDTHMWRRGWMLWRANVETVFRGMRVLFENDPEGMPGEKSGRK